MTSIIFSVALAIPREYIFNPSIAKAIEHYEKFLELWKDADPGIAEIEDAKKSVGELKRQ